jgi:rhodanese-related sulfurtransferase
MDNNSIQIDVREVYKKIQAKENNFVLLDVRTSDEFSRGRISGSINIPLDQIPDKVETILPDKNKTVYVYCLSGSRSVQAVSLMRQLGYNNTFDMISGMMAWRVYKFPEEK